MIITVKSPSKRRWVGSCTGKLGTHGSLKTAQMLPRRFELFKQSCLTCNPAALTQGRATFQVRVADENSSVRNKRCLYSKQMLLFNGEFLGTLFMTTLMLWHIKWSLSLFHLVETTAGGRTHLESGPCHAAAPQCLINIEPNHGFIWLH